MIVDFVMGTKRVYIVRLIFIALSPLGIGLNERVMIVADITAPVLEARMIKRTGMCPWLQVLLIA